MGEIERRKLVGRIESINPSTTSKGTAFDVIIGSTSYSTFRPGDAKPGDNVEVEYVVNGNFNNIQSLKVVPNNVQTTIPVYSPPNQRSDRITMLALLKASATALSGTPEVKDPKKVHAYAKELYELQNE